MGLRRIQTLATHFLAMAAIVTVALAQPLGSPCLCRADAIDVRCGESRESPCCCGERYVAAVDNCCSSPEAAGNPAGGCSCSAQPSNVPASTPTSTARVVEVDSTPHYLLAPAPLADIGLNGASWATAFDLEALGGLPGIRLHALLSVWRN
jgi:hypothetical protein